LHVSVIPTFSVLHSWLRQYVKDDEAFFVNGGSASGGVKNKKFIGGIGQQKLAFSCSSSQNRNTLYLVML
jgi:hypothetical protein